MGSGDVTREEPRHCARTPSSQRTESTLDQYIQQGQAVLNDLEIQKGTLKNVQKKMYSVANTLGVSGNTIRMIERRAREDKWIFWAGVVIFIGVLLALSAFSTIGGDWGTCHFYTSIPYMYRYRLHTLHTHIVMSLLHHVAPYHHHE